MRHARRRIKHGEDNRNNFASLKTLQIRRFPFLFRVVSLGERRSLKPVVKVRTLSCLLSNHWLWCWTDTRAHLKVATHYTYVMEHAQRDLVKYIQSGVTKPLPTLRSREELPWIMGLMAPSLPTIFSCSTFWPVSTSPKSLPLSVTGNKLHGAAQQLLGDVKGLTPRTSFTAQVKYTKCTKRVSQLLEIAAVYKTNGPSIRQKRKNILFNSVHPAKIDTLFE